MGIMIFLLGIHLLNLGFNSIFQIFVYIILLIGIRYCLKDYRNRKQDKLSVGEGFGMGILISFLSGAGKGIFYFFYFSFFNKQHLKYQKQALINRMGKLEITKQQELIYKKLISFFSSPEGMVFNYLLEFLMIGIIFSLILALIMRKKKQDSISAN